ncbi:MAG: transposase [Thermomicrobiales bacterium]|nr:transposase [Thermomicrobiales bacterium]MCO5227184.1 transposase [Thermomicrobiales bacterium]
MQRRQHPDQTRRHRLRDYDYTTPGYYFITFRTVLGRYLLATIEDDQFIPSPTGVAVSNLIHLLPNDYPQITIDSFAIMPNHVHLLIYLPIDQEPVSISAIVRTIKGRATAIHRRNTQDTAGLWHKGFHDAIIRNDQHLAEVRRYIAENPTRWNNEDMWF